jgi:hypothetical protein
VGIPTENISKNCIGTPNENVKIFSIGMMKSTQKFK